MSEPLHTDKHDVVESAYATTGGTPWSAMSPQERAAYNQGYARSEEVIEQLQRDRDEWRQTAYRIADQEPASEALIRELRGKEHWYGRDEVCLKCGQKSPATASCSLPSAAGDSGDKPYFPEAVTAAACAQICEQQIEEEEKHGRLQARSILTRAAAAIRAFSERAQGQGTPSHVALSEDSIRRFCMRWTGTADSPMERDLRSMLSAIGRHTFDQVRDAILIRMGGHTVGESQAEAFDNFMNLLRLVKEEECFVVAISDRGSDK